MYLTRLLQLMSEREASDLFISPGAPIHLKINNDTLPVSTQIIDAETSKKIAYEVMSEEEIARFLKLFINFLAYFFGYRSNLFPALLQYF